MKLPKQENKSSVTDEEQLALQELVGFIDEYSSFLKTIPVHNSQQETKMTIVENKLRNSLITNDPLTQFFSLIERFTLSTIKKNTLVISDSKGFSVVKPDDIVMFSANGYCTRVFLTNNVTINCSRPIKYCEGIFGLPHFMRVHHSFVVNMEHVKKYSNQDEIILTGDLRCPLSRIHKQDFHGYFKNMLS